MGDLEGYGEIKKAAALQYKHGIDTAPKLVAKGSGEIAEQIIAIAREEGIALHEDKALIGMLSTLDLNDQIPTELYRAVAEILIFVYRLNGEFRKR